MMKRPASQMMKRPASQMKRPAVQKRPASQVQRSVGKVPVKPPACQMRKIAEKPAAEAEICAVGEPEAKLQHEHKPMPEAPAPKPVETTELEGKLCAIGELETQAKLLHKQQPMPGAVPAPKPVETTELEGKLCATRELGAQVDLTVMLVSGKSLGTVTARDTWTGADVKSALHGCVGEGRAIDQLCFGTQVFCDAQAVKELDQSAPIVLNATLVAAEPCMHLFKPCSAMELSSRHGSWKVSGGPGGTWTGPDGKGNFCSPGVNHRNMDSAPALAQEVAKEIRVQFENGGINLVVVGNNYGETDEVVVIAHPGSDPIQAILRALGVRREDLRFGERGEERMRMSAPGSGFDVWGQAKVEEKDWSKDVVGYAFDREDFRKGDEFGKKIMAITDVMAKRLTGHFQFSMSTRVECMKAPMIWGGFTSDGSIVGVLGTFMNR